MSDRSMLAGALAVALAAHGEQTRKGTTIPYVSHLLQVSGLVLHWGGDFEQATAAILHDVVEDTPMTLAEVEAEFGAGVAAIVADCTDTGPGESAGSKRPWLVRKREYLARLRQIGRRSALVIACDKLHNSATMIEGLEREGLASLLRFKAGAPQQLWYFRGVVAALRERVVAPLADELSRHAERFAALTGAPSSGWEPVASCFDEPV